MSVTITRTAWIDDDGSGTTGTVINNAVKTDLYNQIDGALAKVAQLVGGNAISGNQAIDGLLTVTGKGLSAFVAQTAGITGIRIQQGLAGVANAAALYLANDLDGALVTLQAQTSTYTTAGAFVASGGVLACNGAGGLSLQASVAAPIRFYTTALERLRVTPAGELVINGIAPAAGSKLTVLSDLAAQIAFSLQNTNPGNSGNFLLFLNSTGGVAGNIAQSGATTIVYGATSDARLKDDGGPAADLSALRAIVVHDFTWKADGRPDRGVFAQDVAAAFPRAVLAGTDETTESGDLARPWMTDYSKFVPDLIAGWQQHDAALDALRARLDAISTARADRP